MQKDNLKRVFKEIHRVLNDSGELVIWDLIIPKRDKNDKEIIVIYLNVEIGVKIIGTGYGAAWDKERDVNYHVNLATATGFEIIEQNVDGNYFFIRCRKN